MEQFICPSCGARNNIEWTNPNEKSRRIPCIACRFDEPVPPTVVKEVFDEAKGVNVITEYKDNEPIRHGVIFECVKGEGVDIG